MGAPGGRTTFSRQGSPSMSLIVPDTGGRLSIRQPWDKWVLHFPTRLRRACFFLTQVLSRTASGRMEDNLATMNLIS
ncbi:hypothetical protein BAU01nite_35660 [Brevibacterium aurantiacum]|nr:hypothetical protein BAU01nite_35660 [Brevibacterium aurantiacum]